MSVGPDDGIPEREQRSPPSVIAVGSGRSGVGKSTVAACLGLALARGGARVCLVDADPGPASASTLLGLRPRFGLEHVVFGAKAIEDVVVEAPYGLRIVPDANLIGECAGLLPRQQWRLAQELARLDRRFDYLLLDTAAGAADSTLDGLCSAHQVLLVITPEPDSFADARSLVELLQRRCSLRYHVVVNMCDDAAQAREICHRFSSAVEADVDVRPQLLGVLPRDEGLRLALAAQRPATPLPETGHAGHAVAAIATALRQALGNQRPRVGFAEYWEQRYRECRSVLPLPRRERPPVPPQVADQAGDLRVLRDRLLAQLRRPDVAPEVVADVLRALNEAYLERLGHPSAGTDALVRWVADHAERVERVVPALAARLQPPPGEPAMATRRPPPVPAPEPEAAPNAHLPVAQCVVPGHGYDETRFGSQQALLERLRRHRDPATPTLALIDALR